MNYEMTIISAFALFGVISYVLGSINFAIITTKAFTGNDVRTSGSGNAGMTNVMRTAGFLPGVITFAGDFLKAIAAVALGKFAIVPYITLLTDAAKDDPFLVAAPLLCGAINGFFCLLGHMFPIFFGFKGGKGIVTAAGMMLILDWRIFLIEVGIFLILFLCSRIISLGSLAAAFCYPLVMYADLTWFAPAGTVNAAALTYGSTGSLSLPVLMTLITAFTALLVVVKHKDNLIRLCRREEPKLILKK